MKTIISLRALTTRFSAIIGLLLCTASSQAALYQVEINTAALNLLNSGNGPFSIDFQLNSGNTLGNNTAIISNFVVVGGSGIPFGPVNLIGGANGSLLTTVTLTDTSAFNEFYQSFTAGSSLRFDLSLTQNVDAGPTPDAFALALLDKNLANIPTNSADFANTLLHADITTNAPLTIARLGLASGAGSYAGITITAGTVPDAGSTVLLFGVALLGIAVSTRKGRSDLSLPRNEG